jgi:hypothetical protein
MESEPHRRISQDLGTSGEVFMQRRRAFQLLAAASIAGAGVFIATPVSGQDQPSQDHFAWVTEVLIRMQTVTAGMTREALGKVFSTEGGLSTGLQRTFVSRDCPYFKVDVVFQAVGRPERDGDGRVTLDEDGRDLISKISKPYLQFSIMD